MSGCIKRLNRFLTPLFIINLDSLKIIQCFLNKYFKRPSFAWVVLIYTIVKTNAQKYCLFDIM